MKKSEGQNKPLFFEDLKIQYTKINEVKYRYQYDRASINFYKSKLNYFEEYNNGLNKKQKNENVDEEDQK